MKRLVRVPSLRSGMAIFLAVLMAPGQALACPFCSAVSQTLRQEMAAMDTVAIARISPGTETDSDAVFSIQDVIRGKDLVRPKQELRVNYFGKAKEEQNFLLMGVDPPDLLWSTPLPVSDVAVKYVESINKLPKDNSLERLHFYLDYLEHPESLLARDAYDEFASAPYGEIKELKPRFDREQLLEWIKDTNMPPDRKRLYLVMLGVCGTDSDADVLEELLRSEDPNRRGGLDSMIACYATLKGEEGLDLIDELFLRNKKSQYADTYAAIMALRFHGTEGGVLKKSRVLESMRLILDRPELADLVIPDLARWEDWSQIDKLAGLFKNADDKSSWVRVPVINYLRACPLPEAAERLGELKELDPAAYKRATSFFPVPKTSSASATDGSAKIDPTQFENLALGESASQRSERAASPGMEAPQKFAARPADVRVTLAMNGDGLVASSVLTSGAITPPQVGKANWTYPLFVLGMASASLGIAMWLSLSGAGGNTTVRRRLPPQ